MTSLTKLSSRQRDVVQGAANGLAAAEMAEKYGISIKTVESKLSDAFRKLGVHNRADAVKVAVQNGEKIVIAERGPIVIQKQPCPCCGGSGVVDALFSGPELKRIRESLKIRRGDLAKQMTYTREAIFFWEHDKIIMTREKQSRYLAAIRAILEQQRSV